MQAFVHWLGSDRLHPYPSGLLALGQSYHCFMGIKATPKIYLRALINISRQSSIIWALQWRLNGCDGVSNHQPHHCLLNGLFRRRLKKTSKLRVTGLCAGKSPVTGEFPAKMASNAGKCFHLMTSSCRMTEKQSTTQSCGYLNIGCPSKTHLTLNSCEISLAHNLFRNCPILTRFYPQSNNDTAMSCAKFKNGRATETVVMDKPVFFRFGFRTNILYCPQNSNRIWDVLWIGIRLHATCRIQ